jgi:gamma-glutamyltranspeptidase/glutathione hydrolase
MVSLTSTLGPYFGSGVVAPGTGFPLVGAVTWFDPRPGHLNSIEPGRRILWAGTPTLLTRAGRPFLAVGAPGARRILTAVVQTIVNVVDHRLSPRDAVAAPRVHCEGRETFVDARLGDATIETLRAMGHDVVVREDDLGTSHFARPLAIAVDPDGRLLRAGVYSHNPASAMGI